MSLFEPTWTPELDAILREHYVAKGAAFCANAIGRSLTSIRKRAAKLRILRVRAWTHADDASLRVLWGSLPIGALGRQLGRSAASVYWRAQHLGLELGCPQGFEYLSAAAARTGYTTGQLRRILRWAGVRIEPSFSRPGSHARGRRRLHVVEPADVDEAVGRWHATEPLESAALRHGYTGSVLRRLLEQAAAAGDGRVPPMPRKRVHWRIPSTLVDELFAAYAAHRASTITLHDAAARYGVNVHTMRAWLARGGVTYGRGERLDPAAVERVVRENVARPGCRAARAKNVSREIAA